MKEQGRSSPSVVCGRLEALKEVLKTLLNLFAPASTCVYPQNEVVLFQLFTVIIPRRSQGCQWKAVFCEMNDN